MKSGLLRSQYETAWTYNVERPISGQTRLKMMAACIGDLEEKPQLTVFESKMLTLSVLFFALGFITSL